MDQFNATKSLCVETIRTEVRTQDSLRTKTSQQIKSEITMTCLETNLTLGRISKYECCEVCEERFGTDVIENNKLSVTSLNEAPDAEIRANLCWDCTQKLDQLLDTPLARFVLKRLMNFFERLQPKCAIQDFVAELDPWLVKTNKVALIKAFKATCGTSLMEAKEKIETSIRARAIMDK